MSTHAFTWEGRRLLKYQDSIKGLSLEFTYNSSGLRKIKKNLNTGEISKYYYEGDKLICEVAGVNTKRFLYDKSGFLYGIKYNGINYYCLRNVIGNIVGIIDFKNDIVVKYDYNAFGNIISITGPGKDIIGKANPFIYKGYYYDFETSLYYCNSRYYNPEWGRWLNADDVSYLDPSSVNGLNLYAYCANNPVMNIDPNGNFPFLGTIVGGILGGLFGMASAAINGQNIWKGLVIGAATGALTGLMIDTLGGASLFLGTFTVGALGDVAGQLWQDGKNLGDVNLIQAGFSGLLNAGMAFMGKGINKITEGFTKGANIFTQTFMNSQVNSLGLVGNLINSNVISNNFSLTPNQIYNDFLAPSYIRIKEILINGAKNMLQRELIFW